MRERFSDHLEALREMLIGLAWAWALGMGAVGANLGGILEFLKTPLQTIPGIELVTLNPMTGFWIALQVITLGGALLGLPLMALHGAKFLSPALQKKEKATLLKALAAAVLLFITGVCVGFSWILPLTLAVALSVQNALGFALLWNAQEYFSLVASLPLIVGAAFCAPVVITVLVRAGVLEYEALKRSFGVAFVVILILAAAITPTGDPLTFMLLALPMTGLYALALKFGKPKKNKASPKSATAKIKTAPKEVSTARS